MATKIGDFRKAVMETLTEYDFNVMHDMTAAAKKRTQEGVKMLKGNYGTKRTGEYNSGWKMKKIGNGYTIYNAKKPELTHILEHGYAHKDGSRRFDGIPHISLVEEQVVANFEKDVEHIVQERAKRK